MVVLGGGVVWVERERWCGVGGKREREYYDYGLG